MDFPTAEPGLTCCSQFELPEIPVPWLAPTCSYG